MEVGLKKFEETEIFDFGRPIYNALKSTLQHPAEPKVIGAKLAKDITSICEAGIENVADVIPYVWTVIIQMSRHVSPDHPWQDCLVQAVDNLRQQEGAVPGMKGGLWKDLPYLSLRMRELWNDPTEINDEEFSEELIDDFVQWKNQNSFAARLTGPSFAPWMTFPIWQLRDALEQQPAKGPLQECRVWVACEWILRRAELIFEVMTSGDGPDDALKTGPLCGEGIPQLSIERWDFWKKRLGEIAADAENLKLERPILGRISDTIERMEAVQK
ncbi:uncharacterized protein GGS22DRAFT_184007 [Annulohypoxylon maeteangense]|uniref:uncharacterized protein n=1 Tax=Annulohypoxylon maeteangense TaxID=1927788 RepID=UPI0020082485|nr:uncharacterized protein GGS22DRAFT_184007 [Annulohypoxylon maeteangense]KAI0890660.1 hypothetical protein GGS22DRAFT_184007 [Annulohypoxylon maeteangense]